MTSQLRDEQAGLRTRFHLLLNFCINEFSLVATDLLSPFSLHFFSVAPSSSSILPLHTMQLHQLVSLITLLSPLTHAAGFLDNAKDSAQHVFDVLKDNLVPDPLDSGAAAVAGQVVERISIRNFQRKLAPKPEGEEEWMIYFTGGNKSCFGRCGPVDLVWNVSDVTALSRSLPHLPLNHAQRSYFMLTLNPSNPSLSSPPSTKFPHPPSSA
jgi:hypothetical protein